ncbi:MAG: phospholipase D-like domain-containing protein, partial [Pseudomonas sp.]
MAGKTYPWRADNSFELLMDGERFFPALLDAVDQAQRTVDIELYLVSSGQASARLIEALSRAVARGVRVRCLFDAAGSREFSDAEREQLTAAGVELRFYNPLAWLGGARNLHRDHRKLIVCDDDFAMVGGMGLTDEFCQPGEDGQALWHEQMLRISGPLVADWQDLFDQEWPQAGKSLRHSLGRLVSRQVKVPPFAGGRDGYGRIAYVDSRHSKELVNCLLAEVRGARSRIWLATPYFLPSWRIRRALQRAARRGVDVRLLLSGQMIDHPQVRFAGQRFYSRLLKSGVRIHEYQPRFLHLKTVLVDDWVSLGSCNFDHWTLHWNLEANQQVVDSELAAQVEECFENDFAQSNEWTLAQWRDLGLVHRLKI